MNTGRKRIMDNKKYYSHFTHGAEIVAVMRTEGPATPLLYIMEAKVGAKDSSYFAWAETAPKWYIITTEEHELYWKKGAGFLEDGRQGYKRLPHAFKAAIEQLEVEGFLEST